MLNTPKYLNSLALNMFMHIFEILDREPREESAWSPRLLQAKVYHQQRRQHQERGGRSWPGNNAIKLLRLNSWLHSLWVNCDACLPCSRGASWF